jgi:hypothetical protein
MAAGVRRQGRMARRVSIRNLTLLLLLLAVVAAGPLRTSLAAAGRNLAQRFPVVEALEVLLTQPR